MDKWTIDGQEIHLRPDQNWSFDAGSKEDAEMLVIAHNVVVGKYEELDRLYRAEKCGHEITAKTAIECLAEFEAMKRKAHDAGVDWNRECDKVNSLQKRLNAAEAALIEASKRLSDVLDFDVDGMEIAGHLDPDGERHGSTDYSWISYGDDVIEYIRKELNKLAGRGQ